MSRLFTHHDRLYLFQSSFFSGTGSAPAGSADPSSDEDEELLQKPNTASATKKKTATAAKANKGHSDSGLSFFIPHFHKMFGLLAICNMLLYITPVYADVRNALGANRLAKLSCVHVILALSSFEFRIGRQRNGLYTIYREMQLHTIIFTLRSWTVMMCDYVLGVENILYRSALVLFWHVMADLATRLYQPPSKETTIRRSVDGKTGYQGSGRAFHLGLWFFSFSQLVGTFMLLTDSGDMARNAMFIMTPVQISAFLATLVRKGYFSSQLSGALYFLVLLPIFIYHHWTLLDVLCMVAAQILRFNLRFNKYPMWIFLATVAAFFKGDLYTVASQVVAPWLNATAGHTVVSAEQLQYLAVPSPDVVPTWVYTETFQVGTGCGQLLQKIVELF